MNKSILVAIIGGIVLLGGAVAVSKMYPSKNADIGAATSNGTYTLKSDSNGKRYQANSWSEYSFSVVDNQGNALKNFAITHTKMMHLIVVRKDLKYFQHLHPDYNKATGEFSLNNLTFPADGDYRIFADFAPANATTDSMGMPQTVTLSEDLQVGDISKYVPQDIGTEESSKTFGDMTVSLATHGTPTSGAENMIMFALSQNGKPVTDLQSYLGALGHAVILREGNLDFIHAHPMEDVSAPQTGHVDFMVDFPEAGKYKVFTQFQRNGQVITTDFVLTVAQGATSSTTDGMNMQGMDHSMH